jgi:riboflavin kinase / FMN adenylyltransferase
MRASMRVFFGVPERAKSPTVLTIGNFDGVHLGHRAMLDRLKQTAAELGVSTSVMIFEPHPRELFAPDAAPPRLTSLREKLALLEACRIDFTYLCHFDRKFAALTADQFINRTVVQGLAARYVIVGEDFCFGKGRAGNVATLREAGRQQGFDVETLPTVAIDGVRVSSSGVRDALGAGDLPLAEKLLGRPYAIAGRVGHGNKLGRTLGFPTANVQLKRKRIALHGVYAVTVSGLDAKPLPGAASLGYRPTLGEGLKPTLEVFLLDFDRDIYGAHVTVNFLHKLRDEAKFESLDELKAWIAKDVIATKEFFSGARHG